MKPNFLKTHWREIISRASLPLLTLGAMYGVYSFSALFVPELVAVIIAGAFELVYVGLAIATDLDDKQRQKAKWISLGAVAVSVSYNWAAGILHTTPGLFGQLDSFAHWILAGLHGAPLAVLAYLVADLLLHSNTGQNIRTALQSALEQVQLLRSELQATELEKSELLSRSNLLQSNNNELQEVIRNGKAHNNKLLEELQGLQQSYNQLQSHNNTLQKDHETVLANFEKLQSRRDVSQETIQELQRLGSRLQKREINIDGFRAEVSRLLEV